MQAHVSVRGLIAAVAALGLFSTLSVQASAPINTPPAFNDNLDIEGTSATLINGTIVFEQVVKGQAAGTVVPVHNSLNGAAVLANVFPTTLNSSDIGFDADQGTVALAVTRHPDFDDTPNASDGGGVAHAHWVVLTTGVAGYPGLAVKPLDVSATRPTTHPGVNSFPIFIDSPGFVVTAVDHTITVDVPIAAVNNRTDFQFDTLTAFLEVHTDAAEPLLGVYQAYEVFGGDLTTLPFNVVPEPGSAMIFGLGLVGIGSRLCRRKTLKV